MDQDVSHGFDVLVAIICIISSFIATRVGVIIIPSSAKPDSGVAAATVIFIVSNDTNSRFGGAAAVTYNVESFLVTVELQRGLRPSECLPRVTAQ